MTVEDLTFYHGSLSYLDDGAVLVPGAECGRGDGHEHVYLTTEIGLAQQFATYDGWIYEVQPLDEPEPDLHNDDDVPFTFICDRARVVRCAW